MKYATIINIIAGSGGDNSKEVAKTILRMYLRWLEKAGYKTTVVSLKHSKGNAIKSAMLLSTVPYKLLKDEVGSHRFTRANKGKTHTSFVGVGIMPNFENSPDVTVNENDLKYDAFLSSGHGGQSAQKNKTAVRVTHIPTGLSGFAEGSRSQHANKQIALSILKSRLYLNAKKAADNKMQKIMNGFERPQFGFRTRTYSYRSPIQVVNHLRKIKTSKLQEVLDGNLGLVNPALVL